MNHRSSLFLAASFVFLASVANAAPKHAGHSDAKAKAESQTEAFKLIHVTDLAKEMDTKSQVYIYDANTEKMRKSEGVIPGATPLESVSQYNPGTVLPQDKNAHLVFYCANTQCMASHEAAKVAVNAGYKNVSVMADGIEGWKKAGRKTDAFNSAPAHM